MLKLLVKSAEQADMLATPYVAVSPKDPDSKRWQMHWIRFCNAFFRKWYAACTPPSFNSKSELAYFERGFKDHVDCGSRALPMSG